MKDIRQVFKKSLQIRNDSERRRLFNSKSAQLAAQDIAKNEEADSVVQGVYNDRIGTVVATDKRVMFVSKVMKKINKVVMPYSEIASVSYQPGWIFSNILIRHGSNIFVLRMVPKRFGKRLVRYIERHIDEYNSSLMKRNTA